METEVFDRGGRKANVRSHEVLGVTLRLGVNGWRIHGERTGVGRYLLNVVKYWTADRVIGRFDQINFYTPKAVDREQIPLPPNVQEHVIRPNCPMLAWENFRFGPAAADEVLFCPSYSRPLFTWGKTVVTIYDATLNMYPQLYPFSARVFYDRLYAWSARHATLVITATEAAKHDIARCYGVPLSRIRVVPLGIEDIFRPRRGDSRVEEARKRYLGSEAPYFLFVGKLSARRNAPRLLEAFAELKRRKALPHKLLLIGPNSRKLELSTLAAKFGIAEEVVHHQYVSDEDLSSLYSAAELFVMPSSFEAVSLTVMEAQASGTPVISIDTPGMREVTGGAALLMPTADVPRIVEAISRLGEDTAFRQELSERGLDHARQFSWQRCSSETLHILEEAALLPRASVYRSAA